MGEVTALVAAGEEAVVYLRLLVEVVGDALLWLADDMNFVIEVRGLEPESNGRFVALGPGNRVVAQVRNEHLSKDRSHSDE